MRIDLHHHFEMPEVLEALQRLENLMTDFGDKLARLEADVAKNDSLEDSMMQVLTGVADQVRSLKAQLASAGVPADQLARLDALASHIEARAPTLAAAAIANTDTPASEPAPATPPAPDTPPAEAPADAAPAEVPREPSHDGQA